MTSPDTRLGLRPAPTHWCCRQCDAIEAGPAVPHRCARCGATQWVEVRQAVEELIAGAGAWIMGMAVPGRPFGRFRYSARCRFPWLLSASAAAWRLLHWLDIWNQQLSERQRDEWVVYWLSLWDPSLGMFVDPIRVADDPQRGLADSRWWSNTTLIPELRALGHAELRLPPERVEDPVPTVAALERHLESLDWERDPYSAGSQARAIVQHQRARQAAGLDPDDEVVEFGHRWLDDHQRADTGMWYRGEGYSSAATAGAYKTIRWVYAPNDWPVHHPEAILRYAVAVQGEDGCFQVDDPCHNFDALYLIREMLPRVAVPPAEAYAAAARALAELRRHRKEDGGFSWFRHAAIGALPERGLLPAGTDESEMTGTQYWLEHASYILDILEGRSETAGFRVPADKTGSAGGS